MIKRPYDISYFVSKQITHYQLLKLTSYSGLDDLRDWTNNVQSHIPIYVAQRDFEVQILLLFARHI